MRKKKRKHVDFLYSLGVGVVDDAWNDLFDVGTILQLSALWAYYTTGCITGFVDASPTRHDSARSPSPPPNHQTDLGAALLWPPLWPPQEAAGLSGDTKSEPVWLHTGDCGTSWSGQSAAVGGFKAPDTHGATFTLCCISAHLFRRGILEILKSKENYNKMLKNNRVRCVFCVSGKTIQDLKGMLFCF